MKKSRKEFIKRAHEAACSEWKTEIEKQWPKLFKTGLEVGKWYKHIGGSLVNYQGGRKGYGFTGTYVKYFFNEGWSFSTDSQNWKPATDKEVEEALIKEAKKTGFKRGDLIDNKNIGFDGTGFIEKLTDCEYKWDGTYLNVYGMAIFSQGKWATIIETITKEEAEKQLGKKIC